MQSAVRPIVALVAAAMAPLALSTLTGCASTADTQGVEQEQVYQTPGGVAVVDTFTTVATVTAIDAAQRKVTLTTPDGKSDTFKAAKGVDLAGFQPGAQIGVQLTDAIALQVRKDGTPASDTVAVMLASASGDGASAQFEGEAMEVAAKVTAIDPQTRKVTFQLADGSTKTIKAHKKVDLSGLAVGDTVIVQYAESMIVAVANP
jgi:hypothetical protein